jgi:hypothetical protein
VIFGDFYVMFQRENHFINKRLQKPRRLNLKCIPGVNIVNKTNRHRYNSVLKILCKIFFLPTVTVIVAHPVVLQNVITWDKKLINSKLIL